MPTLKPRTPKPGTSLLETNPTLAAQWHPTLNGNLTPNHVTPGTHYEPWWQCPTCLHPWTAPVYARTHGNGCPNCAGQVVTTKNSLKALHPALAAQWHPEFNAPLTPATVHAGSSRDAWWTCPVLACGHTWKARISWRSQGIGCPGCSGLVPTAVNNLAVIHPGVANQWHPTLNAPLTANEVTPGSASEPWWQCGTCSHAWKAAVYSRVNGNGCPACRGYVATPTNSLATLNPLEAGEWNDELNAPLTANDVTPGSNKTASWTCTTCDHTWKAVIASRAINGNGCPACDGKTATPATCLATLNPDVAAQWHPAKNAPLTPDDVTPGSNKKIFWVCPVKGCGHIWDSCVFQRTRGEGCPSCSGTVVTAMNSLQILYRDLASQWHPTRNDRTPSEVTAHCDYAAWWLDPACGHEWQAVVYARVAGNGCPACPLGRKTSKQEIRLRDALAPHLPIDDERKVPRTDGLRDAPWNVDILCTELKLVIEFDGVRYHGPGNPTDREKGAGYQLNFDRHKAEDLRTHGWDVIRVREAPMTALHRDDVVVPAGAPAADVARIVLACLVLTRLRRHLDLLKTQTLTAA